jgi:hypothetical protein
MKTVAKLLTAAALVALPVLSLQSCARSGAAVPAYRAIPGIYLGRFAGSAVSTAELEAELGRKIAIHLFYLPWRAGFGSGSFALDAAAGRLPYATWEFTPSFLPDEYLLRPLQYILDGKEDRYLREFAQAAAAFGKPLLLRWGHEMNGDWYAWSGARNGGGAKDGFGDPRKADGPERYVAAFRYIRRIFDEAGAANVVWAWTPNVKFARTGPLGPLQIRGSEPWNAVANYYPGDDAVDWIGLDGYNWGGAGWQSFDQVFGATYAELRRINADKPMLVGEFASAEAGGDKAAWIKESLAGLPAKYPRIRAVVWFDVKKEADWRIDSSPASLAAFKAAVAGPLWLDAWPGL